MAGANNDTGQPTHFRCSWCRARVGWQGMKPCTSGFHTNVKLTGRVRVHRYGRSVRTSPYSFEYRCECCEHIGWSRHTDLERKAKYEGIKLKRTP